MSSFAWLAVWRHKARSFFVSGGFLLAACALILLSATTQTTVVRANQLISQQWRSTYDLVVLPSNVQIPAGKAIPADLIEGYGGSISVAQYEQIKRIPGVEVAAPIAFVGYAQLPIPLVQFSSRPLAPGYYRLDWTLSAFNGQRPITERQTSTYYWTSSSCEQLNGSSTLVSTLAQQHVQVIGCGATTTPALFPSIDTGVFLLAAIDPSAESQLVHLNQAVDSGRMLTPQDTLHQVNVSPLPGASAPPQPTYTVPLLVNSQLPGQITLTAHLNRVATDSLTLQQTLAKGGYQYLNTLPDQATLFTGHVPLTQNDPQRLSDLTLLWNGHSWSAQPLPGETNALQFLYAPSGVTYTPTAGPNGQSGPAYILEPASDQNPADVLKRLHLPAGVFTDYASQQGPEVAFRTLKPLVIGKSNVTYESQFVGSFAGDKVSAQFSDALNWLPETTYVAPPTTLRYDANGRPVNPVTLLPTTNPAGFILQAPLAFTTLAAAEQLEGDHLISVIRVRISGVSGANNASWQRIEQIAQEIERQTGLKALVTLGSSPQPTLVYVSGVSRGQDHSARAIAPEGWVQERWITLGAALIYLGQLGSLRLLILGATLFVCLGYTSITLTSLASAQRKELAILSALGWRSQTITRSFLGQALILAGIGAGVGVALAVAIAGAIGVAPPLAIVIGALPLTLGLALLSAAYPLIQLRRLRPAEAFRVGSSIADAGAHAHRVTRATATRAASSRAHTPGGMLSRLPTVSGLAVRNLLRSRLRALISIGSLFCSAILLIVVVESILSLRATLQGTLLGNAVLAQTAAPQIAGGVFAIVLTFA